MVWTTIRDKEEHYPTFGRCVAPRQIKGSNASTYIEHCSDLDIDSKASPVRLSGILSVIGHPSYDPVTIEKMIESGMNIACLNLYRGTHDLYAEAIQNIRTAAKNYSAKIDYKCPVGIAVAIKGPIIRTGFALGGYCVQIELKEGETIQLTTNQDYIEKGSSSILFVDYENIAKVVKIGGKIYIDEGRISLICTAIEDSNVICLIETGGLIRSRRRVRLPGARVDLPLTSKRDKSALRFAVEQEVDFIFLPNIRHASTVKEIRGILGPEGDSIKIVANIDNAEGLENIDEIIKAFDGISIARYALGIELSIEQLFLAQKSIIARCNKAGKPVVCSTHMLESMMKNPRPTRAESCDVANAVLDGADCVTLFHETAKGNYPVESISIMSDICKEAEAVFWRKEMVLNLRNNIELPTDASQAIAIAAADISVICDAGAIVVVTNTFRSARLISNYRPRCPIIAVTRDANAARQAHLYRGILPLIFKSERAEDWYKDVLARVYYGINFGRRKGFLNPGDTIVVVSSSKQGAGFTDKMKIMFVTQRISSGMTCCC